MPIIKRLISQRYFNQFSNDENFSANLGDFTENLAGGVGEFIKVISLLNISWVAEASVGDRWTVQENAGTVNVKRSSGNFVDDGFWDGASCLFKQGLTDIAVGAITLISESEIEFSTPVAWLTSFPNGEYDDVELLPNANDSSVSLTGVFYNFGIIQENEAFNNLSKVSNNPQAYYFVGLSEGGGQVNGIAQGLYNDFVTGNITAERLVNPDQSTQQFQFEHIFKINPVPTAEDASDLLNNVLPELFTGDSLKYALEADLRTVISNPNKSVVATFDQNKGSVGWFGENFNGLDNQYRIVSVAYEDAATGDSANGLQISSRTRVTITVAKNSGGFSAGQRAGFFVSYLPTQAEVQNTATTQIENFISDSFYHNQGDPTSTKGGVIRSLDSSIVGGELVIVAELQYNTSRQLRLTTDSQYRIAVQVADASLSAGNSDRVMITADVGNYQKGALITGLANVTKFNYLVQGETLGTDTGETSISEIWNEDVILVDGEFTLDLASDKQAFLTSIEFQAQAVNTATGQVFAVDNVLRLNTKRAIVSGGAQQIEVEQGRGYDNLLDSQFNLVRVNTGTKAGDLQSYSFAIGQRLRWQDWQNNPDADTVFYDNAKPQNNLNFKTSNYSGENDYEIRLVLILNSEGLDDLGRQGIGQDIYQGGNITVLDYSEEGATAYPVKTIQTLEPDTLADLGGAILDDKPTLLRSQFSFASASIGNALVIHRYEKSNQAGGVLPEIMAELSLSGGILTADTLLDSALFERGIPYNFTARLFDFPQIFTYQTAFDATSSTYSVEIPVSGDWFVDGVLIASNTKNPSYTGGELDGTLKTVTVISDDFSKSGNLTFNGVNEVNGIFNATVFSGVYAIVLNGNSTITELKTAGVLTKIDAIGNITSLTKVDISESQLQGSGRIILTDVFSLVEFAQPNIDSLSVWGFQINDSQLSELDISKIRVNSLDLRNSPILESFVLSPTAQALFQLRLDNSPSLLNCQVPQVTVNGGIGFNSCLALQHIEIGGGQLSFIRTVNCDALQTISLGTAQIGDFTVLSGVDFNNCGFDSARTNAYLIEIDRIALTLSVAGSVVVNGLGNDAPTGAGITAKNSLISKGYIVNTL